MTNDQQFYLGFVIGFLAIPVMIGVSGLIVELHYRWKNRARKEDK